MAHKITCKPYELFFKFEAGTSRGVLTSKTSYFIIIEKDGSKGIGEAGPLPGLSIDFLPDLEFQINTIIQEIASVSLPQTEKHIADFIKTYIPVHLPSVVFAFETALNELLNKKQGLIFKNDFSINEKPILINGLVWMGNKDFMLKQVEEKLKTGYSCIKLKIGAIDFDTECAILSSVRDRFSKDDITLRVDANGAFNPSDALYKLDRLAKYDIHSIEQPIKQGQTEEMASLCRKTPIAIALDEELIGIHSKDMKAQLLDDINPQYIILKPTLVGGVSATDEWITLSEQRGIDWWMTSALESNVGLNAVSQLTAQYLNPLPQGLGTGQLYTNNLISPLALEKESLYYKQSGAKWDTTTLEETS